MPLGSSTSTSWAPCGCSNGRGTPELKRFVYVSSGAVYRDHGPDTPGEPLPEDGYVAPEALYGISKWAAEMVAERYAELFGLSAVSVRLSSVYGTMDRATASRNFRHVPNRIAHMALERRRDPPNTLEPSATTSTPRTWPRHPGPARCAAAQASRYNIALGETATIGDMIGWAAEKVPGFRTEVAADRPRPTSSRIRAARRHVGRLRHQPHRGRDRLAAAAHARGLPRLHGLDRRRGTARVIRHSRPASRAGPGPAGRPST